MRLTLRTLLAYLDDRLPPANARELGLKIANSPFATELVERIRDVKRRRRLASSADATRAIDANLVAEYLDDQLTPELVARVEREVLASDVLLAEVASVHEILGLLQDQIKVVPTLRDRLYRLDPVGTADVVQTHSETAAAGQAIPAGMRQWTSPLSGPELSRRWGIIVAAVLALFWLAVLISDSDLFSGPPDAPGTGGADTVTVQEPSPAPAGNSGELVAAAEVPPQSDRESSLSAAIADSSTNARGAEPSTAASETVQMPAVVAESTGTKAVKIAVADPAGEQESAAQTPPVTPAAAAVVVKEPANNAPVKYFLQADNRVVLMLDPELRRWSQLFMIPGGDGVETTPNQTSCGPILGVNWFGVPESFQLSVRAENNGWLASLLGPCVLRFPEGRDSGLNLLTGRLRLTADKAVTWNDQKLPVFRLETGSQTSQLTLKSVDTQVAIETVPGTAVGDEPNKPDDPAAAILPLDADLRVQVTVLEGSVEIRSPGAEAPFELPKGQRATWLVLEMREFSSLVVDSGEALAATPAWLLDTSSQELPEAAALKSHLLQRLEQQGEPGDCVMQMLSEKNPQLGVLAVSVLSLTRDAERLLSVLFEPLDESIHRAAIDGLSAVAVSSSIGRQAIQTSLETRLPMSEMELAMQLIGGITPAQAADPQVTDELIRALGNEHLGIRTLAIYRLEQLTNDRLGYHPDADSVRRRDAIKRWQRHVEKNSGKVIP